MKYPKEWKGRLRVKDGREVYWDNVLKGVIVHVHRPGAKSPGGMVTDSVFVVNGREFASMTQAIESLVGK